MDACRPSMWITGKLKRLMWLTFGWMNTAVILSSWNPPPSLYYYYYYFLAHLLQPLLAYTFSGPTVTSRKVTETSICTPWTGLDCIQADIRRGWCSDSPWGVGASKSMMMSSFLLGHNGFLFQNTFLSSLRMICWSISKLRWRSQVYCRLKFLSNLTRV